MTSRFTALLCASLFCSSAVAQSAPLADSAAAARAAWSRANAALRSGDINAAHRETARAASAWGVQPAYVWGHVRTAALSGDSAALRITLAHYAALGLGGNLRGDTLFDRYRALPWFAAMAVEHERNRTPMPRSKPKLTLADSTFWPEGVSYDARTRRFYVASIKHGTIAVIREDGSTTELWPRDQPGFGSVLGVRVDPVKPVIWATVSDVQPARGSAAPAAAALLRINQNSGAIERRWTLAPSERGHTLGDLLVAPTGDVFITDSNEPFLYRLRPGADTLERTTSPLFRSLQGLALTPDGRTLYLADYSHGLLRVDLVTGVVSPLPGPSGTTSVGTDGIAWYQGSIIAIQNGLAPARVMRYPLDPTGTRITRAEVIDRNYEIADEPTIGVIVDDTFVYVATGSFEKYNADGSRNSVPLRLPVLLALPLRE